MATPSSIWGRVPNDMAHDLAAGLFPGTVLAAWIIDRYSDAVGTGSAALSQAASSLWLVFFFGLAVSVLTGLVRLRYWKLNVRSGFMETKETMAVVKHSGFVLLLLGSAAALYAILPG